MMRTISIGRWQFECDPELTAALLGAATGEPRTTCNCAHCRNFRALGSEAFDADTRALLGRLGIDPCKPSELHDAGAGDAGKVPYAGWFHFVGGALTGDREGAAETVDGFKYFIIARAIKTPERLLSHPVLQLEFQVSLPWVIDEPVPA